MPSPGLLESIRSPRDVQALSLEECGQLAGEIRRFLVDAGLQDRRSSRAQPGRGRAHHRAAPGLRLAARHGSSGTPATSPTCTSCSPAGARTSTGCAQQGRPVRLPEPRRVRARRRRELARLDRAVARPTAWPRPTELRAASRPPRRRRHRRRRAHRRHGLGGAEQHRRRAKTARWSSSSTTTSAPTRPTIGGLADHLATLRTTRGYERFLDRGKRPPRRAPRSSASRSTRRCTA